MKKVVFVTVTCFFSLCLVAQKPVKKAPPLLKNLLDSFSYAAGYNVATNMMQQNIGKVNMAIYKKAMEDVFANKKSLLTQQEISMSLQFQLEVFRKEKLKNEKAKGAIFLTENKKQKGVEVLPNGLQYQIIKSGEATAAMPTAVQGKEDSVVVNYIGMYIDGVEFENSYKNGRVATFKITNVIRGWTQILQLMRIGDKWKVFIPSDLAYGDEGKNGKFAGSTLVFEISLEGINPFVPKQ